jgi:hypothetical protein
MSKIFKELSAMSKLHPLGGLGYHDLRQLCGDQINAACLVTDKLEQDTTLRTRDTHPIDLLRRISVNTAAGCLQTLSPMYVADPFERVQTIEGFLNTLNVVSFEGFAV